MLMTRLYSFEHDGWVEQAHHHHHHATEPAVTARFVGVIGPLAAQRSRGPGSDGSSRQAARHHAERRPSLPRTHKTHLYRLFI